MKKTVIIISILLGPLSSFVGASASEVVHLRTSLPTGYLGDDRAFRALEATLFAKAAAACAPLTPYRDKAWQQTGAYPYQMTLQTDFRCGEVLP